MPLLLFVKDPDTDEPNCLTVWADLENEKLLFLGWKPDEEPRKPSV